MDNFDYGKDNLTRIPFEHYKQQYLSVDPNEAARRCAVDYDEEKKQFSIRIMDRLYRVDWPEFECYEEDGSVCENANIKILILRYLNEGRFVAPTERTITYHDFPWGDTYFRQFEGRCMKRMAYGFGYKLKVFEAAMEKLGCERMQMGDISYKVEFMKCLFVYFILWAPDDEFDPACQMLFSDNFPQAFTAEDVAHVGDISIGRIKEVAAAL